jgi:transcriptional regulator EpsA
MAFLPSLSNEDIQHYHRVVTHAVQVRSHFDALVWLQGDMQRYLPHDILIAAWGNFADGDVRHDVISALPGVRSHATGEAAVNAMLRHLFSRWIEFGKLPFAMNSDEGGFAQHGVGLESALGDVLQTMRGAMVHGISDARGNHDCLYVTFSSTVVYGEAERSAMTVVLPYVDTALRQVTRLPHLAKEEAASPLHLTVDLGLTERESEILHWVTLGKTNLEIGSILEISVFTVKNHMQRVFKKLNVSNRAQAVGKFRVLATHA